MALQESLKLYKLSLNKGKEETLGRPIITPISIAKKRISDLFDRALAYEVASEVKEGETLPRGQIYIGRSSLITDFKSILATSGVNYGEILNYSLSVVERKIGSLIVYFLSMRYRQKSTQRLSFVEYVSAFFLFISLRP
jgi:hypothetical protein